MIDKIALILAGVIILGVLVLAVELFMRTPEDTW